MSSKTALNIFGQTQRRSCLAGRKAPSHQAGFSPLILFCWLMLSAGQQILAVDYPLRWRWSNPAPHGNTIMDMAYSFNQLLAVQVGERGQIYTSDNLDLWIPRQSQTSNYLRGVTFFGPRIVVVGENGCVLYADSVDAFTNGVLVDGPTTDWLEAVAASSNLAVAVGDNGAVYTSTNSMSTTNGMYWKKQPGPANTWLYGVAFGNGVFVMVGELGYIATSPNGSSWTRRTSGTTEQLNRVTFSSRESRFTAVGDNGFSVYSINNGLSWYQDLSGATSNLYHTTAGNQSRIQVGENEVRLATNGVWSNELAKSNGPPDWTYYANVGRPDFYVISGQSGMMAEGSTNLNNEFFWTPSAQSVRNWLWDVTCQNHLYVAVGDFATVMTSVNGVTWQLEVVPLNPTNSILFGVGGSTNMLVAVGSQGSLIVSPNVVSNVITTNNIGGTNIVLTNASSSFGVIWRAINLGLMTNDLQGVDYYNGLYVVTGDNGVVLRSSNGTNWVQCSSPTTKLLTGVVGWPGGWAAVGDDGAMITSLDGIAWTPQTAITTNWLYRVRYLNGNLIVVGQNGCIYTSPNGSNWTARTSGTTKWLTDAAFIDDTYFVVGYFGTVLTSTNLSHWSSVGTITKKTLYGAATDSRQLIGVGLEGAILRCQVLPDPTPVRILQYSTLAITNSVQNIFLFGGKPDQRFTLDRVQDMAASPWVTGPLFEFFDTSGTLYYLETIYTNAPVQEFYRATIPDTD